MPKIKVNDHSYYVERKPRTYRYLARQTWWDKLTTKFKRGVKGLKRK